MAAFLAFLLVTGSSAVPAVLVIVSSIVLLLSVGDWAEDADPGQRSGMPWPVPSFETQTQEALVQTEAGWRWVMRWQPGMAPRTLTTEYGAWRGLDASMGTAGKPVMR